MSARLLTDELWNEIESLFPIYQRSPDGGRPPVETRVVRTGLRGVLTTGIAWEDLPLERGCSSKTCKRRLAEWSDLGIWQQIFLKLLTRLRAAGRLELADVLIDAGLVKAPLGGQKPARIPRIAVASAASII